MMRSACCSSPPRHWFVGALVGLMMFAGACKVEPQFGASPEAQDQYYDPGSYSTVSEPIAYTDVPYDFTGPSPIADLLALYPSQEFVWYGLAKDDPYPVAGDCDPGRTNNQTVPRNLDQLPMTIEGVVTLHPRYFQKITVCGGDERYYGSYMIQDSSGGILVLKDSRIAEFDYGDRVRLRVRGIVKHFDTRAVLVFDQEEVLNGRDERQPVHYEAIGRAFREADVGRVMRIRGRVVSEATNQNFNEMHLEAVDGSNARWIVSLDAELGRRGVAPPVGSTYELTGPVVNSFGLRMLIASLGQLEKIED